MTKDSTYFQPICIHYTKMTRWISELKKILKEYTWTKLILKVKTNNSFQMKQYWKLEINILEIFTITASLWKPSLFYGLVDLEGKSTCILNEILNSKVKQEKHWQKCHIYIYIYIYKYMYYMYLYINTHTHTHTHTHTYIYIYIYIYDYSICVYTAHHFILLWLTPFDLSVDRERWWFEHSVS